MSQHHPPTPLNVVALVPHVLQDLKVLEQLFDQLDSDKKGSIDPMSLQASAWTQLGRASCGREW